MSARAKAEGTGEVPRRNRVRSADLTRTARRARPATASAGKGRPQQVQISRSQPNGEAGPVGAASRSPFSTGALVHLRIKDFSPLFCPFNRGAAMKQV